MCWRREVVNFCQYSINWYLFLYSSCKEWVTLSHPYVRMSSTQTSAVAVAWSLESQAAFIQWDASVRSPESSRFEVPGFLGANS